jgi:hypothetical protein
LGDLKEESEENWYEGLKTEGQGVKCREVNLEGRRPFLLHQAQRANPAAVLSSSVLRLFQDAFQNSH